MLAYLVTDAQYLHSVQELNEGSQTIVRPDYTLLGKALVDGFMADHKLLTVAATLDALGISYDPEALYGV